MSHAIAAEFPLDPAPAGAAGERAASRDRTAFLQQFRGLLRDYLGGDGRRPRTVGATIRYVAGPTDEVPSAGRLPSFAGQSVQSLGQ